jgi:serine/threonine protein kinase
VVYECLNPKTKERVAVKHSELQLDVEGIPATALREISILRELQHDNIVK